MPEFKDYTRPNPDDPRNLVERLNSTGVPMNKGIAMFINAPALVEGYSCEACGHDRNYPQPIRMDRGDVRHACCRVCGSERITLRCRGGV